MSKKVEYAIARLLVKKVFYGQLLARFKKINDPNCPAPMATALNRYGTPLLYLNEKRMKTLTDECRAEIKAMNGKIPEDWEGEFRDWTSTEIAAVLEHECLHQINLHPIRRNGRSAMMTGPFGMVSAWNIACDLPINQVIDGLPKDCIDHTQFKTKDGKTFPADESAENYYSMLMEAGEMSECPGCGCTSGQPKMSDQSQGDQQQSESGDQEQSDDCSCPGESQEGQQGQEQEDDSGDGQGQSQGNGEQDQQEGNGGGQTDPNCPQHGEGESGDGQGQSQGSGQGQSNSTFSSGGNTCPACETNGVIDDHSVWENSEAPSPDMYREKVRQMVGEAYRKAGGERGVQGYMPAGAQRMIEDSLKKPYDWRPLFRKFVNGTKAHDRIPTRFKPNKRFGYAFPGAKTRHLGSVGILVDTSGSIGDDELAQFQAELNAVAEGLEVIVVECDADIQNIYEYKRRITKPEYKGGGGTVFHSVFNAIKGDYDDKGEFGHYLRKLRGIEALIVLTDGYASVPKKEEIKQIPVLWALLPGGRAPTEEYGIPIFIGKDTLDD